MAKGGGYEGEISKEFSLYLTHMKTEDGVWRTESSGARATQKQKAKQKLIRPDMFGDITYTVPETKYWFDIFSIECKTGYPKTSFWQHFTDVEFGVQEFWQQALDDADKAKKNPMLIYRKKYRSWIVGINRFIHDKLHERIWRLNSIEVCWSPKKVPHYDPKFKQNPSQDCILYDMKTFFDKVKPDDIRRINGNFKLDS